VTRELRHPEWEIEDDDAGLRLRFRVPGSKFGPIEIVFSLGDALNLVEGLSEARASRHECEACGHVPAEHEAFSPEDGDLWFCDDCYVGLVLS
jgi:hypothetical protein